MSSQGTGWKWSCWKTGGEPRKYIISGKYFTFWKRNIAFFLMRFLHLTWILVMDSYNRIAVTFDFFFFSTWIMIIVFYSFTVLSSVLCKFLLKSYMTSSLRNLKKRFVFIIVSCGNWLNYNLLYLFMHLKIYCTGK